MVVVLWFLWFVLFVIGVAVLLFMIDAFLRRRMDAHVTTDIVGSSTVSSLTGISDTLIVYLPGILSGARSSSVDLIDTWRRYGDVMLVEYGNGRFKGPSVVRTSVVAIKFHVERKRYRKILFIGSSMGGLLAVDVIKQLQLVDDVSIRLLLLDAPTSARDLYAVPSWAAAFAPWLVRVLTFGPIWNSFNLMRVVPPKEKNIEWDVDRAELARRVAEANAFTLSFWRDQLLYIMLHGVPPRLSLESSIDELDFVHSSRDNDTVRPQAFGSWAATVSFATEPYEVDSTHVGFAERPETWRQAFDVMLPGILGW